MVTPVYFSQKQRIGERYAKLGEKPYLEMLLRQTIQMPGMEIRGALQGEPPYNPSSEYTQEYSENDNSSCEYIEITVGSVSEDSVSKVSISDGESLDDNLDVSDDSGSERSNANSSEDDEDKNNSAIAKGTVNANPGYGLTQLVTKRETDIPVDYDKVNHIESKTSCDVASSGCDSSADDMNKDGESMSIGEIDRIVDYNKVNHNENKTAHDAASSGYGGSGDAS